MWGALTDHDDPLPAGARVKVSAMRGTRVVVVPVDEHGSEVTTMSIAIIILVAVFIVGIAFLIGAVKIVRPYQRGLVERLGRYKATRSPAST